MAVGGLLAWIVFLAVVANRACTYLLFQQNIILFFLVEFSHRTSDAHSSPPLMEGAVKLGENYDI